MDRDGRLGGLVPREYYSISDMRIGGDGQRQNCDFETQLIDFAEGVR
jgi:hypothetical protein